MSALIHIDSEHTIINGSQGELFFYFIALSKALKDTMDSNVFDEMVSFMLYEVDYE